MARKTNQQKFEEKLYLGNNYDEFCHFVEQQTKLLSDRNLLFWRLWLCNHTYMTYGESIQEELVQKKGALTENQFACLQEILRYGWELFDNEKALKKKRLKELHQQLKEINTTELEVTEVGGCALYELVKAYDILLTSLIKGKRNDDVILYKIPIDILKVKLEKEKPHFPEAWIKEETWDEIDMLHSLLTPKYNNSWTSNSKELFRRPYRHNK